jgi:ribosomal protein RSM22 (predicted rRNA methylase)
VKLPGDLDVALAAWLEEAGRGGLSEQSSALSKAYKVGGSSAVVSLAAYVAARVPATFAANGRVLQTVTEVWPDFSPKSLLDVGAGPGVASWAAMAHWPEIATVTQVEHDTKFVALARAMNAESEIAALQSAVLQQVSLQSLPDVTADLVVASYVLAEMPVVQMASVADRLWAGTARALVLIEPGTPAGFQRLRIIRDHLLKRGAHVVAPCTHEAACPMTGDDWCHFKVRLSRSRAHMHAKGAVVPFEDEAFSYLAVARENVPLAGARVMAPPDVGKAGVDLRLCDGRGLSTETIARRNKASYKQAKHLRWGDLWT